jgi:hypothetical protein
LDSYVKAFSNISLVTASGLDIWYACVVKNISHGFLECVAAFLACRIEKLNERPSIVALMKKDL